ncbi:MAG: hypothetical protein HKN51_15510 [Saprospiraceae bacterium]|nr:hypothetical protein [Saprospiraceae bacterium]
MKHLLILILTLLSGNNFESMNSNDFDKLWKEVEAFEKDRLPQSAFKVVETIYLKAKDEKVDDHLIKAIIYKAKLSSQFEDFDPADLISDFEKEKAVINSKAGQKIFSSMIGELYHQYGMRNMHRFQNRTQSGGNNGDKIEMMTLSQIQEMSIKYYLESIDDIPELKIGQFDAITQSHQKAQFQIKSTSVYQFLMTRALIHFSNSQSLIALPIGDFSLNNPDFFKRDNEFKSIALKSEINSDFKIQALKLFQEVANASGFSDEQKLRFTFLRLDYLKNNAQLDNKEKRYIETLKEIASIEDDSKVRQLAYVKLIDHYLNEGERGKYESLDFDAFKEAYRWIQKSNQAYPDGEFNNIVDIQKTKLNDFHLRVQTERVVVSDEDFLTNIHYRNTPKVYFNIYKLENQEAETYRSLRRQEEKRAFILNLKADNSWHIDLPKAKDFNYHNIEVPMDKLSFGNYVLMSSNHPKFIYDEKNAVHINDFQVSDLTYIYKNIGKGLNGYVLNRKNGSPVSNAKVQVYLSKYNSKIRKSEWNKIDELKTGKEGQFNYNKYQSNFSFRIIKDDDVLDLRESHYNYGKGEEKEYSSAKLFTDRSIYRPGQLVYFKGIITKQKSRQGVPSIESNKNITVKFLDANWQVIDEQSMISNEFGTFSGSFSAPLSGLTGRHQIMVEMRNGSGQKEIRIEEYKRPKFYVDFDTISQAFVLGDTIKINGDIKAFSGVEQENVQIKYHIVKKKVFYPFYRGWIAYPPNNSNSEIIARGVVNSDKTGAFEIKFETDKDYNENANWLYEIKVDANDITGSSATGNKMLSLSNVPFVFKTNLPSNAFKSDIDDVKVEVLNLEGAQVTSAVNVTIHKKNAPEFAKKTRYWSAPDINYLDKSAFEKRFPNDEYGKTNNPEYWETVGKTRSFKFESSKKASEEFNDLDKGAYMVEFEVKTPSGLSKKYKRYINITDTKGCAVSTDHLWVTSPKADYQPGDKLNLDVNVPYKSFNVHFEISRKDEIVKNGWIKKRNQNIEYEFTEKDRGGLQLELIFVMHNRVYTQSYPLNVSWKNKNLTLELHNFRNKIEPGSEEEITIKVKDYEGKNVSAEILASMYDKSLDQFVIHNWLTRIYPNNYGTGSYASAGFSLSHSLLLYKYRRLNYYLQYNSFTPKLNWFGFAMPYSQRGGVYASEVVNMKSGAPPGAAEPRSAKSSKMESAQFDGNTVGDVSADAMDSSNYADENYEESANSSDLNQISLRENLNETVFFYPNLVTDEDNGAMLKFKMNEALTKWNLQLFAHTKDLKYAFKSLEVQTQKDLIIEPNLPRFVRQGDVLFLNAKVTNFSDSELSVSCEIQLEEGLSKKIVTDQFLEEGTTISVALMPKESKVVTWKVNVPIDFVDLLDIKMLASSDKVSDGELNRIPVLSNRILITESMVMNVDANTQKTFEFESLFKLKDSNSIQNHNFTVEYYSNPNWLVLQSLPSLIANESESTSSIFDAYFGENLGFDLISKNDLIKRVIVDWQAKDLKSNLSKNEALKISSLNETPWLRDAILEEKQMSLLSTFLDENTKKKQIDNLASMLIKRQLPTGGFSWMPGGRDNWYITQYILEGIIKLQAANIKIELFDNTVVEKAVSYIDKKAVEVHEKWEKSKDISPIILQYLFIRSHFNNVEKPKRLQRAIEDFKDMAKSKWTSKSSYLQALIAYTLFMDGDKEFAFKIMTSLNERLVKDDELGYYWNDQAGYYWYNQNLDNQSFMISLYELMEQDPSIIDGLKLWLLKNKQVNSWKTTKATSSAVYAFMNDNGKKLTVNDIVKVSFPQRNEEIIFDKSNAAIGYQKRDYPKDEIELSMSSIKVVNDNDHISWGSAHWQYFEDISKVESSTNTPLKLQKELFKIEVSDQGETLVPLEDEGKAMTGDKIRVKVKLIVDRPMEFIQMKDLRGSGMEPINVLSQYKYQDGLGYYESTKDVASYFYFDYLPKGSFVFEYDMFVVHEGEYSSGHATIQSMYAPEFSSHSQSTNLTIGGN